MAARPIKMAIGFVDWHTAVIASGATIQTRRAELIAQKSLVHVERVVSDYLRDSRADSRFRVRLRVYSGWHSGTTPTDYHRGITRVIGSYASKTRPYHNNRIIFEAGYEGIQLGNRLAVVQGRMAPRHGVHFLDTLRHHDGTPHEKTVDTALAIDLLGLANRRSADHYIVVSDDDDMLPGIFAAEATGVRATMLSRPDMSSRFMAHARDLIHTYEPVPP